MNKIINALILGLLLVSCQANQPAVPTDTIVSPEEPVVISPGDMMPVEPDDSIRDGKNLERGAIFINASELMIMESFPIQVMLNISGDLPTPCNMFVYSIEQANQENEIHLDVYSLSEPGLICIQVLEPFAENIPISSLDVELEDGDYTVWVNGELVGEFSYPGG